MNIIHFALRKPISILVLVAGLFFFGIGAIRDIKVDILPKMDLPVIYIAHPFGGYTPDQMEAYFGKSYVAAMLFANGVKSMETKTRYVGSAFCFNNKGEFKGRVIGSGDNVRIYDNNGQFKGRIIQDKDGNNTRIYDNKGNFQGRVIK